MKRQTATFSILLVLTALIYVTLSFKQHFVDPFSPITDPSAYERIVAKHQYDYRGRYDFLPKSIPTNADKIAFYYQAGVMQGADTIALRLHLPKAEVQKLQTELSQSGREEITNFGKIPAPYAFPDYSISSANSKNLQNFLGELPPDFQVYLYKSSLKEIEENWNHHFLAFTAISIERSEIVYFVKSG